MILSINYLKFWVVLSIKYIAYSDKDRKIGISYLGFLVSRYSSRGGVSRKL